MKSKDGTACPIPDGSKWLFWDWNGKRGKWIGARNDVQIVCLEDGEGEYHLE